MNAPEDHDALAALLIGAREDLLLSQACRQDSRSLARFRSRVYSQNGEDGAIAEIFRRVGSPTRTFLEIGAGDGEENCTRFLLEEGWRGRWCECDPDNIAAIRAGYADELRSGRLQLIEEPITRENAPRLFPEWQCGDEMAPQAVDLLVIDIDMNTSHVWSVLEGISARAAVIEYNAAIPPSIDWEVPYYADAVWLGDSWYGASLKRLERIGWQHRMRLVGCELSGINAFFVRDDLVREEVFLAPFTAERHHEPQRVLPPIGMPARPRRRTQLQAVA